MKSSTYLLRPKLAQGIGHPHFIHRPHMRPPSFAAPLVEAKFGVAKFIPVRKFALQQYIESIRDGENAGGDYPYNHLVSRNMWKSRRYNVDYQDLPLDLSPVVGVYYASRIGVWVAHWTEEAQKKYRFFRVQSSCFSHAKKAAETFRKKMEAQGREDTRRTARQARVAYISKAAERRIRRRRYRLVEKGYF